MKYVLASAIALAAVLMLGLYLGGPALSADLAPTLEGSSLEVSDPLMTPLTPQAPDPLAFGCTADDCRVCNDNGLRCEPDGEECNCVEWVLE